MYKFFDERLFHYQIIQEHHGQILVESQPGKGSVFTVVLPTKFQNNSGAGPQKQALRDKMSTSKV